MPVVGQPPERLVHAPARARPERGAERHEFVADLHVAFARGFGVFGAAYVRPVAEALLDLGAEKALVVHGTDGMDEITVTDKTLVADVSEGEIVEYEISPEDFGLPRHAPDGLLGGDAHLNARVLRDILTGEERGASRDIVLLNAGAAIHVSGRARSVEEGVRLARDSISDGAAATALEDFIKTTRRLSGTV